MTDGPLGLPARAAAVSVLLAWDRQRRPVTPLLAAARRRLADPRDRALVTQLVQSTLRWLGWADAVLDRRLRRGIDSVAPPLKAVLRLGIVHLFRVRGADPHGVVHTSVALAGELGFKGQSGLVNAVLRGLLRRPPGDGDLPAGDEGLAAGLSHPRWLIDRWISRYGRERTLAICRWNTTPPVLSLRIRGDASARAAFRGEMEAARIETLPGAVRPDFVRIEAGFVPEGSPWVAEGRLVVQDESEALVALLGRPGSPVLDACAGPGTKTGLLADGLGDGGRVIAWDVRHARSRKVAETARRLRLPGILTVTADLRSPPVRSGFRSVFVDAPCTNLGVLCRRPDARWLRRPEEIEGRSKLQEALLASAAERVERGGSLVYSVCSLEPEETERVVAGFLQGARGRFELGTVPAEIPAELHDGPGILRVLPGTLGMEGVYAAVFDRV